MRLLARTLLALLLATTATAQGKSLLFYGNGLALIGRSKVFYDIPRGFDESFAVDRGRFGDILVKYFEIEAADEKVGRDVAGRNRCYFWSIIGELESSASPPRAMASLISA